MDEQRKKLIQYLANIERQLYNLYGRTYRAALELAEVRKAIEAGETFTWRGNPAAEKRLNQYLNDLATKAGIIIQNGVQRGYIQGEKDARTPILAKLGTTDDKRKAINELCEAATKERRAQGMTAHAFATAERGGGLTLSSRVWNLTGNAKQELETIIQNGILEGKGAKEIASGIKGYLNNPNALFRRVRNKETGNLELSEAAKKYHPGQGVYRSAYKNALRLVRTEMNAAYRRAEWESYQNNPLITGYEIRLSNNHTTTVNGKVKRLVDICDTMAGRYPKTFRWTGWHPNCRCVMVPIVITPQDFGKYLKAKRAKKLEEWQPKDRKSKQVVEVPKELIQWIDTKQRQLRAAKVKPDFVGDNKGIIALTQQKKVLSLFAGTLQQFADTLFKTGRSMGQVKQIGRVDDIVREDMAKKGHNLETETIIVLDRTVLKYIGHPKESKGATVAITRYGEIETAINTPTHIYEDLNSKDLVYVYTHPYEKGKVIKVVVHPNYKYKGVTANVAKSWGVVNESDMNTHDYRLIK